MLNLVFIPSLSLYGAAITSVITQFVIFCLLFKAVLGHTPIILSTRRLGAVVVPSMISGAVVAMSLWALPKLGLAVLITAAVGGAIVYSGCFLCVRGAWMATGSRRNVEVASSTGTTSSGVEVLKRS